LRQLAARLAQAWKSRFGLPVLAALLGIAWLAFALGSLDLTPIKNSEGYLMRSEHSLLSREFYFGPRPFVTSLMYKLYGSTEAGAVRGQLVFSTVAWLTLTVALGRGIRRPALRLVHTLVFPSIMAWWNVMGWNMVMRAESTTFSWFALWCAALVSYCQKPGRTRATLLALASFFLCFTRDSLPLLVGPVVGLLLVIEGWRARRASELHARRWSPAWSRFAILTSALVVTAALQFATSQSVIHPQFRTRHEFPLVNVIIRRVLPKPEVRKWFAERGMPVHLEILKWKKQWASGSDFAIFEKKKYGKFRTWVREEGKYTYLGYLAAHPGKAIKSAFAARRAIFATNLEYYTGKPPARFPFQLLDFAYPLVSPALALLVALALVLRCRTRQLSLTTIAFAATVPLVFVNGFFVFHMDAMEVERHALLGMVALQVAAYAMLLDAYAARPASRPSVSSGSARP